MPDIEYERINWENGMRTPLGAANLNKGDKAIDDLVKYVNKSGEYTISANNWQSSSSSIYPYINTIGAQGVFSNSDYPIAQVWGMGEIETSDEMLGISYIAKVIVDPSGIKVYATSQPTVDLKLILKN